MLNYKLEKEFEYKGYTCVVLAQRIGHRCGYIGIDKENACYEKDYDSCDIEVHGGLTYDGGGENSTYPIKSNLWWIGFDCAHSGDAKDNDIINELNEGSPNLDFLLSLNDYGEVRTLDYCVQECESVVDQLIKINDKAEKTEESSKSTTFELLNQLERIDWNSQQNDLDNLLRTTVSITNSTIDNEGIYKTRVAIKSVNDLVEISRLLDDNLLIYGADSDILMTVKTMQELGLS